MDKNDMMMNKMLKTNVRLQRKRYLEKDW